MAEQKDREEGEYILGTDRRELERLGFQHQVWAPDTAALWRDAGFTRGHALLDVGCGPGYATLDLAHLVGSEGSVLGVDVSERFLGHLERQAAERGLPQVEVRQGDVGKLELEEESFDGAFARWVLCFTPDPAAVVRGVARALRPGGTFAVLDYLDYTAFRVAPESPAFQRVIEATGASFRRAGGDADVARRIPGLMRDAGLEVSVLRPVQRIALPGTATWFWPQTFFHGYANQLVEMGMLEEAEAVAFREEWELLAADPSAYLLTATMAAVVGVKNG
jgi:SAM-dependent methyltransferase